MKCSEIIEGLQRLAPESCACDWDNPGLLAGRSDKEVKKIYIALDATDQVVEDAVQWGADMLLTHHPLIFKAIKKVNDGNFITRRLVKLIQADIDLGDTTGQTSYYEEAVTLSESLISQKWATRTTYNNLAILHQKLGQLDEAEASLETMKDLYGEDYNLYKRYAFIELDRQALKENLERDYAQFAAYYEKAMALYDGNNEDAEMALLQTQYAQVQEGGWLS